MAEIPIHCPIDSIAYCRPVEQDLQSETVVPVERVIHNFELLVKSAPKGTGSENIDIDRCMKLNPNRCVRAAISMQACRDFIESLEHNLENNSK